MAAKIAILNCIFATIVLHFHVVALIKQALLLTYYKT